MIKRIAQGNKKSEVILFLHGAWHGAWCWERYFMDIFAEKGYDNYAFTLRQHENPGKVKGINKVSLQDYVTDLEKAVSQLEQEPIIVGHSMGGIILQKYLEKNSCKKAILLAPCPPTGVLNTTLKLLFAKSYALPNMLSMNLYGMVNSDAKAKWGFFSEDISQEDVDFCLENLCSESYNAFLGMLFPNVKVNYHTQIPMLVLGVENDKLFTVKQMETTAKKYKADLKILPNIAHDLMLDTNHREAAEAIIEWIEKGKV